jgi:hypothetical protein
MVAAGAQQLAPVLVFNRGVGVDYGDGLDSKPLQAAAGRHARAAPQSEAVNQLRAFPIPQESPDAFGERRLVQGN